MNWSALTLAFGISVLAGGFLGGLLQRSRAEWSARRRLWASASVLPAFILFATVVGLVWIVIAGPGEGENMQDLAIAATATIGSFFAAIALVGGLIGASFAERRKQP